MGLVTFGCHPVACVCRMFVYIHIHSYPHIYICIIILIYTSIEMMDDCQLHADSKDDVLSVGAGPPMNQPGMCCARLDDFDWVVHPYEPDGIGT